MKAVSIVAAVLVIIGALNWGLVALAQFDLVASLFADGFGTTSALSRLVYALVGLAAIYHTYWLTQGLADRGGATTRART